VTVRIEVYQSSEQNGSD